jgi:hypothetical protein
MSRKSKRKIHKNNPATGPTNRGSEEKSTSRHVYIEPGVQIDIVKDLKEQHKTERTENTAAHKKQLFWTKIASGLLFLTAIFAFWQGLLTRESINNNSRQFQIDQRPYVLPLEYFSEKDVHIVANERMWVNFNWVNYGKSPAVRSRGKWCIFIGANAMQQADEWFAALGDKPFTEDGEKESIVPPGIPSDPEKKFPGTFSTAQTDHSLKPEEAYYILHTDWPIAIVLRKQYYDLAGNRYWTDACFSRFESGAFPACGKHNEIH